MTIDMLSMTLRELSAKIRSREIGCETLLDFYLERISRFNAGLNAIVVFDLENARERAIEADKALARGEVWGPLHGVPVTVKESFDIAGLPTTWGVPELRDNVASSHSGVVKALLAAGAIIMGKTNIPHMISDWQTYNDVYGETKNPWDPALTPGGSSGGSAAAIAARMTALEVGSDIGSSIRNPAHYCGVYGHKPSFGIVPQTGHAPIAGQPPIDMLVCGPFARHADDLELALDVIAGPDAADAVGWKLELPAAQKQSLKQYRVAVMLNPSLGKIDQSVIDVLGNCIARLSEHGLATDFDARPQVDLVRAHELYLTLLRSAMAASPAGALYSAAGPRPEDFPESDKSHAALMARAGGWRHREWVAADTERNRIREAWAGFFENYDLLLCPVAATAAYVRDTQTPRQNRKLVVNGSVESFADQFFWAGLASLAYLPATIVPAGLTDGGLPVGMQIIGPYLRDRETIQFARLVGEATGAATLPPAYRD